MNMENETQMLSRYTRDNIVQILTDLKKQGDFNNTELCDVNFNKLSDKELINLRDNELVHIGEFGNKEYMDYLQNKLYDDSVYEYWNIKK